MPLVALVLFFIVPWRVALPLYVFLSVGSYFLRRKVTQPQRWRPVIGKRAMIGDRATVVSVRGNEVEVAYHGETWQAVSARPLTPGQQVVINNMEGLILEVAPLRPPGANDLPGQRFDPPIRKSQ